MEPWIEKSEPFILVGPEGCGKDMIIRHAFSGDAQSRGGGTGARGNGAKRVKTTITVLHCNARTTAEHVITKVPRAKVAGKHCVDHARVFLFSSLYYLPCREFLLGILSEGNCVYMLLETTT